MKTNMNSAEEWPLTDALQRGITLEESKRRVENVIYDHFHAEVCA
jgi:hypothetical protein